MLQKQIVSLVISRIGGGVETDESPSVYSKIAGVIDIAREVIIGEASKKSFRKFSQDWFQTYEPVFDPSLQESSEFTIFPFPAVTNIDSIFDGNFFIGSRQCSEQFRRIKSRGEYYGMKKHKTKANSLRRYVYYLFNQQTIEVYSPTATRIEKIRAESIFSRPEDIPTFNVELDNYPMDDGNIPMLLDFIKKNYTWDVLMTPMDTRSDSKDTPKAPQPNQQRR